MLFVPVKPFGASWIILVPALPQPRGCERLTWGHRGDRGKCSCSSFNPLYPPGFWSAPNFSGCSLPPKMPLLNAASASPCMSPPSPPTATTCYCPQWDQTQPGARQVLELGAWRWELGAQSWELGAGIWELRAWGAELGAGSCKLGAGSFELGSGGSELGEQSLELGAGSWDLGSGI